MTSKNNINWFMWIGFLTIAVAVTGFCVEVSNKFQPTVAQVVLPEKKVVVEEEEEEQVEQTENDPLDNDSQAQFVTDVDMSVENWQKKETEFFTVKFPKEWYWLESEHGKNEGYSKVITNNPNFDIDKYADVNLFSDIGQYAILELTNNTEIVISFRVSPTTNAGTPQDRLDSIFELAKENNPSVECEVFNNKTMPFTAYCIAEYENLQLQQSYYSINEGISLTSTAITTQETVIGKRILDIIAKNIVLKTSFLD